MSNDDAHPANAHPPLDLSKGIPASQLNEGEMVVGQLEGEDVLLARHGGEVFAVGAKCSHYGGHLERGLMVGDTVRCPLHHACFSLRTGEVLAAPALDPIPCWQVETRGDRLIVLGKAKDRVAAPAPIAADVSPIVIVGGGAAGHVAAETLRKEGYLGKLTILSADTTPPCDRPNLSKEYLTGQAPEEWMPLRPKEFFEEHHIDLVLGARVTEIDVAKKKVVLENGSVHPFTKLLLATGADAIKLAVPGAELPHVHSLRTMTDSKSIIADAVNAKRAVVVGASFIGLEVAAALRTRGLDVHVIAPEHVPFERILGAQLGAFLKALHEEHGVVFHLGRTVKSIAVDHVILDDGTSLPADMVVAGIGVRPSVSLAEKAGLALDRGVLVDEYLETSVPGIFAAGDLARWPDPHTGEKIRVEHWVVAERHGQLAALNILGRKKRCDLVPFFWSRHHNLAVGYVGHAEKWDRIDVDGDLAKHQCKFTYLRGDKVLAVATIGRHRDNLRAEVALESETATRG